MTFYEEENIRRINADLPDLPEESETRLFTGKAPQSQASTQEQLEWLRAFYNSLNQSPSQPKTVASLIRLANVHGLYDAADHVQRMSETGPTTGDKGLYMLALMEW
jgi:hypothetical protein